MAEPTIQSNLRMRKITIYIAVLIGTLATLFLEHLVASNTQTNRTGRSGFQLSDFFMLLFVPVGTIAMSVLSASIGLYIAYRNRMRIRGALAWGIVLTFVLAFCGSKYIQFKRINPILSEFHTEDHPTYYKTKVQVETKRAVGFGEFIHRSAVLRAYAASEPGQKPQAVGGIGYLWIAAGLAGYAFAWMAVPWLYQHGPYCRKCERFMSEKPIAMFPAGLPFRLFARSEDMSHEEYEKKHAEELHKAVVRARTLEARAKANDIEGFLGDLKEAEPGKPEVLKLPRRLETILVQCPDCASGYLDLELVNTQDDEDLEDVAKTHADTLILKTDFMRILKDRLEQKS